MGYEASHRAREQRIHHIRTAWAYSASVPHRRKSAIANTSSPTFHISATCAPTATISPATSNLSATITLVRQGGTVDVYTTSKPIAIAPWHTRRVRHHPGGDESHHALDNFEVHRVDSTGSNPNDHIRGANGRKCGVVVHRHNVSCCPVVTEDCSL